MLVGLAAAIAIIAIQNLLHNSLMVGPGHRRRMVGFFLIFSIACFAGSSFLVKDSVPSALVLFVICVVYVWAALGTALEWPGFRVQRPEDECPECGYNLTGNKSGICPECGSSVPTDPDAML